MQTKPKYKNRSWLREQYAQKGKTMDEIAEKADCSHGTVYRWIDKFDLKKGDSKTSRTEKDDHTVRVTKERAQYIREHMDTDNEELQEETGLTEYVIKVIKKAKRNNFYKGSEYNDRGGAQNTKFDKMSDKMESWLREKVTDKKDSWKDITNQFNKRFGAAEIAPISEPSINRWGKKLAEAEGSQNV